MKRALIFAAALAALLWPRGAQVKAAKKAAAAAEVFLFEVGSGQSIRLTGDPRPNRVHVVFSPEFNDWVFVLADSRGRLPEPREVLVVGSVVNGEQVGAPSSTQGYVFMAGGHWAATSEPRQLKLIVLGEIPTFKTVTFEPVSNQPIAFVNPEHKLNLATLDPYASR